MIATLAQRMRDSVPSTEDDLTILQDGLRLDSREPVEAWLMEVDVILVSKAAAAIFDLEWSKARPNSTEQISYVHWSSDW